MFRKYDLQEEKEESKPASGSPVSGIPEFWLTALRNNQAISSIITERDEEAMKSLEDVKLSFMENNSHVCFLWSCLSMLNIDWRMVSDIMMGCIIVGFQVDLLLQSERFLHQHHFGKDLLLDQLS
jgi:hypothetical protein